MMIADAMEELGIPRGSYVVKVNNRKVLDGALDAMGLGGEENASKRLTVLRAIDKLDRLGPQGVRLLLGKGRKDESGDFTPGAGLQDENINFIVQLITSSPTGKRTLMATEEGHAVVVEAISIVSSDEHGEVKVEEATSAPHSNSLILEYLRALKISGRIFVEGTSELEFIASLVSNAGYKEDQIRIDPTVVRGLEYYTGPVFEVELTFPVEGEDGKPVRSGSVAGGGRYDGLVGRFRGDDVPATGISIGVSRLMAALQHLKKIDTKAEAGPVVVTVFDQDRIADYQKMVAALRNAGIRAELYLGSGKFGAQMKYADRRGAPCAVIQGGDEKAKGEVQIKDLILGAAISSIKDREEYKAAQAKAQYAVPEDQLVEEVRKLLDKHGVKWN